MSTREPAGLERALDHERELVDVERLGQVVVCALLHRGDRDALAAVRGEQDRGQRGIARGDLTEQRHAVDAGHL